MSLWDTKFMRRNVLLSPLAGAVALVAGGRAAQAQEKASLIAKSVDRAPGDPEDPAWDASDLLPVPLAPQAVVKPRRYETGIAQLDIRALYDAERLAILLEWADAAADTELAEVADFRDAVALEFPANPADGIPYFAMGEPGKPVTIYQWKADWQFAREFDIGHRQTAMIADWYPFTGKGPGEIAEIADYAQDRVYDTSWAAGSPLGDPELQARTPVEKLHAEGFGTLTAVADDAQDATGAGINRDGRWRVVVSIPRDQGGFAFAPGMTLPFAFAAWDGARAERGGEKAVSTWYFLSLEQPVGNSLYWAPVAAAGAVLAAQWGGLKALRGADGGESDGDRG